MASLGLSFPGDLQFPVDCYTRGPRSRGFDQSSLGVDPALERLEAPHGSQLANMAAWAENFFKTGAPDDEFAQLYHAYAKLNPDRARVPTDDMEELKRRRAGDFPAICEIERACAPEARDVVPPAHAPTCMS